MALADTRRAIGAVTRLIRDHLDLHPEVAVSSVTVGRPETQAETSGTKLNLFLYEVQFDGHLKNTSLDEGQAPPLWLVLRYLLTAFDGSGESDSIEAHEFLGEGIRAMQELSFLALNALSLPALNDNPETLKITFDETPSDLLAKLMQGSEESYRCSIGFQVRPVMIAPGLPPSYSLLVGINYEGDPMAIPPVPPSGIIGEEGIHLAVLASLGPMITRVSPEKFEAGATLTLYGTDLHLSGLSVMLGSAELAVTAQQPDRLQCLVNGSIPNGSVISAGSHPVCVALTLPGGRRRSSNLLVGALLPTLTGAVPNSLTRVNPAIPASNVFGNIVMNGVLLGAQNDDIFVALYQEGRIVRVFDRIHNPAAPSTQSRIIVNATQTSLTLIIVADEPGDTNDGVPPGAYRVILRVNGQQAKNSPAVNLVVP